MSNPVLFPQTLLDIKVTPDTVLDLYRNCGLPESVSEKLFADLSPFAQAELGEVTRLGLQGAHEGNAKLCDLQCALRYILLYILTDGKPRGESK